MQSLIYFLIWGGLFFLMMRFGCGAHVMGHGRAHSGSRSDGPDTTSNPGALSAQPERAIDPVCRMNVETAKSKSAVYSGHVYYFCSTDCRGKFEADPQSFLKTTNISSTAKEHQHAS